jgi:hypothetical protein
MGRPLKIAKAQAVVTITDTAVTTNVVTTSANFTTLGIIAGMPFVPASTVGGLTGGTMYWILKVINAGNNSTFTASATPLNANPTYTSVPLSNASGQTVSATVAPVDMYFNNPNGSAGWPATNSNTYSVVGGNTSLYGNTVLCNVGFGVNGTGTEFASTTSNVVVGLGTDFANVATGTILYAIYADSTQHLLGTTTSTKGNLNVAIANTTATGNIIGTSGNAQTLVANTPVVFDTSFGGLTAGATYFVGTIANAAAFTVSTTRGGPNVGLSSNASVTAYAIQNRIVLAANSVSNSTGATGLGDPFIQVLPEAGYIVRQKGKQKYLVKGTTTGIVSAAYTANLANTALTPNTMTITATYANTTTVKVQSLSDHTAELFTATSGPVATGNIVFENASPAFTTFNTAFGYVVAGSFVTGSTYTIVSVGSTDFTLIGAANNTVGTTFVATGAGTGTGTASLSGIPFPLVTIGKA